MKALLITPDKKTIEAIEISGRDDLVKLIGYDTITSDEIGSQGDRLYFDEECFLRGTSGRFQIDTLIPVSGAGVIVGSSDESAMLRDAESSINDIQGRIKFL